MKEEKGKIDLRTGFLFCFLSHSFTTWKLPDMHLEKQIHLEKPEL